MGKEIFLQNKAFLRINTKRLGDAREVIECLSALEKAYNHLYAFEIIVHDAEKKHSKQEWRYEETTEKLKEWKIARKSLKAILRPERIVLLEDRLQISRIRIESPGFWEFLGALSPLETVRKYLNDRHERMKDVTYRNNQERVKNTLEIKQANIQLVKQKIELLRSLEIPEEQIRKVVLANVQEPLLGLDNFQDKEFIENAEFTDDQDGTLR